MAAAEQAVKGGKANVQALIQAPAPTRSFRERRERDSAPGDDLHVLLRHRPLSIALMAGV